MRCERPDDRFHHIAGIAHRVLEVDRSQGRAATVTDGSGPECDRAVRQIGDHHLIAWTERQRAKYCVQAGRDVGDEHEIVRTRAEEPSHLIAGFAQARHGAPWHRPMSIQFAQHESRRLAFYFIAECLLFLNDAPRGRAHGAVIEGRAFWIEPRVFEHAAAQGQHFRTLPGVPCPLQSNPELVRKPVVLTRTNRITSPETSAEHSPAKVAPIPSWWKSPKKAHRSPD